MNIDNCKEISDLTTDYISSRDKKTLDMIEYLLKIHEYQLWKLKYELRLIEHPHKFRRDDNIIKYEEEFSYENAYSKYHLILPLLMYLFVHHKSMQPALETSLNFMNASKEYLKPGDFAKTKTGAQRFITNTRFASLELRNLGLLRSDNKRFFKYWELSLFGYIVAGHIYLDFKNQLSTAFFNNFSWYKAKKSTDKILQNYTVFSQKPDVFKFLVTSLFKEEVVADHFKLYSDKFAKFAKYFAQVLETGYNVKFTSTKELTSYLNIINADPEISKFVDSIIMKKDIALNLADVYTILNNDRQDVQGH